ncbi:hypothetical protein RJ639_040668 [Escallonia herrerae]|uniref:J domain-containing protein n=1 Tax=Escallonia herrerae TaxID=1293975 RepID=A0AA89BBI7_9ASTE|nr:hypothetical protein RJ639_040668 [Escallonia herrerae]
MAQDDELILTLDSIRQHLLGDFSWTKTFISSLCSRAASPQSPTSNRPSAPTHHLKQCQYKVLGLGGDCTADEIRSAYRRLALQCHPDKLAQFDISPAAYRRLALQAYQTSPFP